MSSSSSYSTDKKKKRLKGESDDQIIEEEKGEDYNSVEWAQTLSNLSTPLLASKLTTLKTQSANLASTLTAKLASSPSGQSLLHIGPSLSTLPPDLQSLLQTLKPLLNSVTDYEKLNQNELVRVVTAGKLVERECRRASHAMECKDLLQDLISAEDILTNGNPLNNNKKKKGSDGHGHGHGHGQSKGQTDSQTDSQSQEEEELHYMASLERVAHTTLHLVHQLDLSSAQVTSSLASTGTTNGTSKSTSTSISNEPQKLSMKTPLPQDTEKAQFLMKLAPRIRKLQQKVITSLSTELEAVLQSRLLRLKQEDDDKKETLFVTDTIDNKDTNSNNSKSTNVNASTSTSTSTTAEMKMTNPPIMTTPQKELLIIGHLLRAFALLSKGNEAEFIFAKVAILPIVKSKISIGKLDEGGSRGECVALFSCLEDMVVNIRNVWGDVLQYSNGIFSMDANGNVIGNVGLGSGGDDGCFELMDYLMEENEEKHRVDIDLITAGVWVPIATTLMTDAAIKMAIFSPGIASVLQANYIALDTFLSELASNLLKPSSSSSSTTTQPNNNHADNDTTSFNTQDNVDEAELTKLYYQPTITNDTIHSAQTRLYTNPSTIEFNKKWNLPIYYQLRFGEISTRLDKAIEKVQKEGWFVASVFTGTEQVAQSIQQTYGLELPFFMEVYDIMTWLWQLDVFLKPLTHRFLRGAIQLLGRVMMFIKDGVEGKIKFGEVVIRSQSQESGSPRQQQKERLEGESSSLLVPRENKPMVDNSYYWKDQIDAVAAVAWDLTILETFIGNDYVFKILEVMKPQQFNEELSNEQKAAVVEHDELKSLLQDALVESMEGISPIIQEMWNDIIVNILTSKCSTPLSAVKGVAATYRMTNRPPPTQASPFVSVILRPLKEFDDSFSSRTPPQVGSDWKTKVISSVAEKYSKAVSELLETVQRTEEALKNRKSSRRTAAGGMSDGEKVKLQLFLDQNEFCEHVEEAGVDKESIQYLTELVSLTKSAEKLLIS